MGILTAQTGNGRVQGTIQDVTGAVIPAAKVQLVHVQTGVRFDTHSNALGFYLYPSLPMGAYTILVEFPGMAAWKGELFLQVEQTAVVNVALTPAGEATQVTVVGDVTPLVTTTSGSRGAVLEKERLEQLPLNGRSIHLLVAQTTPGFEQPGNFAYANGIRSAGVDYLQDGASIVNRERAQIQSRPPGMDSIQEARVETNASSAKFDRPATVILTTPSGTNRFHGSAFETARNNGMGIARRRQEFFSQAPQLIRNEYGVWGGGPLMLPKLYDGRSRTFVFGAWEEYRLRSGSVTGTRMPTAAWRQGNFAGTTNAAGQAILIYDPWTTNSQTWLRAPYPGNVIPPARMSPLAKYLYERTPAPTLPDINPLVANNFFGPSPNRSDQRSVTFRVDHNVSDRDRFFARFSRGDTQGLNRRTFATNGGPILTDLSGNTESNPQRSTGGVINWNHTFSPVFFVETILSVNQDEADAPALLVDQGRGKNTADLLGLPNPLNGIGLPDINGMGNGFMTYQGPRASVAPSVTRTLIADQNYSWVRGKHELQFGWRYRSEYVDMFPEVGATRAGLNFSSLATSLYDTRTGRNPGAVAGTGNEWANLFLGVSGVYTTSFNPHAMRWLGTEYAGYVQDNWRLTPRLTLNAGLRYEYYPPFREQNGLLAGFDTKTKSVVTAVPIDRMIEARATMASIVQAYHTTGVKFLSASDAGLPENLLYPNRTDFNPRAGFAYRLGSGKRTMSVRGGYGLYRFPLAMRAFINTNRSTPPMQGTFSKNYNNAAQSPDGLANYWLRNVPAVVAGVNSRDVIDPNAPPDIAPGSFSVSYADPHQPTSRAHQWNLTVERELLEDTVVRAAYVGSRGEALDNWLALNDAPPAYVWMVRTGTAPPTGRLAGVATRPFDQSVYGNINQFTRNGYSNFNSLQLEAQRRYKAGLAFQMFYVLSNGFRTQGTADNGTNENSVGAIANFLPGAVPEDVKKRTRLLTYMRDTGYPKHRMRWNWVLDLPFGKGKRLMGSSRGVLQYLVGGWQLAGSGHGTSTWISLPTTNWGAMAPLEFYKRTYPIQDCRSGECVPGYLWFNGYIPANRINSTDASGRPNGVMGVPANYRPAIQPIWPTPAAGADRNDPNFSLYETNQVMVPLSNGTTQRVNYDTNLHPWINQKLLGPWNWGLDASLFKVIPIGERVRVRFNADFFSVLNNPGTPAPDGGTGLVSLRTSANNPRQLQLTLRLIW